MMRVTSVLLVMLVFGLVIVPGSSAWTVKMDYSPPIEEAVELIYEVAGDILSEIDGVVCIHDSSWVPEDEISRFLPDGGPIGSNGAENAVVINYAQGWSESTGWRYLLVAIQADNCDQAFFEEFHGGTMGVPPR